MKPASPEGEGGAGFGVGPAGLAFCTPAPAGDVQLGCSPPSFTYPRVGPVWDKCADQERARRLSSGGAVQGRSSDTHRPEDTMRAQCWL